MLPDLLAAIPAHPTSEMPLTPEILFSAFLFVPVALFLSYGVRHLAAGKRPILLMCLLGGGIASVWEPIVDTLGLCYIKGGAETSTFTLLDRTMPLFIPFVYVWYVGGMSYLSYRLIAAGITTKGLFTLYLAEVFVNIWLESPGVLLGAYEYYGSQPFNFWGLPLWWPMMNPVMPLLGGALIYKLEPHLKGWHIIGIIPIIPMVDGIANAAIAWPMWLTLNAGDISLWWTYAATLVTLALALYSVWMLSLLVSRPAEEVRRLTKRELLREAMSGDAPLRTEPKDAGLTAPPVPERGAQPQPLPAG
ncbi:hypothetical protein [Paraconexibacter sp.]|uniref:hypothetical protein n=1 Tax=Paraconexibacter sp. TaxID=2949640 RepID=UPI00356ADC90